MQQKRTLPQEYCIAFFSMLIALLARFLLDPILEEHFTLSTFLLAFIFTTYLTGWGPSLLSAVTGFLLAALFFMEPRYGLPIQSLESVVGLIFYILTILSILLLSHKAKFHLKQKDRLQEESILREKWLQQVVETTPDIMFIFDIAQFKLAYANRETVSILGMPPEILRKMEDQILQRIVHPDDLSGILEYFRGFHLAWDNEVLETEKRFLDADGNIRVFHIRGAIFRRDEAGHVIEVIGACRDVTRQKQAEQALQASEQRFRATFDNAGVGVAHTSLQGQWIQGNQRLCEILGYSFEELMNKTCWDLTHPDDFQIGTQSLTDLLSGEIGNYTLRKRYIRKDNSIVWTQVSVSLKRDENRQPLYFIVIIEDISAQMEAEEKLKQMNQHLENLVAERTAQIEQQSHKLRQLVMEITDTEQRERHRLAEILHDHLQQLLVASIMRTDHIRKNVQDPGVENGLLELKGSLEESVRATRSLTAELMPPALQENRLAGALHYLAAGMKKRHNLDVELHMVEDINLPDEQIRVLLYQGARELLFNVIKHAQTHRAVLLLSLDEKIGIRLTVEDFGKGFDESKPQETHTEGGFGLFSIRERIRLLGGSFDIRSQPGQGTLVSIAIPYNEKKKNFAEIPAPENNNSTPPQRASKMTKVLLADDHQIVREGIAAVLEDRPEIEIIAQVSNGLEAVEMTREHCPDVVVMDVNMPVMDGIEATRRIKQNCPEVQIIGLSVCEEEAVAEAMKQAGAFDYLFKGGDINVLIDSIMSSR